MNQVELPIFDHAAGDQIMKKEQRTLIEKLSNFHDFPEFWEEDHAVSPEQKAREDQEVEEFARRLEESSKVCEMRWCMTVLTRAVLQKYVGRVSPLSERAFSELKELCGRMYMKNFQSTLHSDTNHHTTDTHSSTQQANQRLEQAHSRANHKGEGNTW